MKLILTIILDEICMLNLFYFYAIILYQSMFNSDAIFQCMKKYRSHSFKLFNLLIISKISKYIFILPNFTLKKKSIKNAELRSYNIVLWPFPKLVLDHWYCVYNLHTKTHVSRDLKFSIIFNNEHIPHLLKSSVKILELPFHNINVWILCPMMPVF